MPNVCRKKGARWAGETAGCPKSDATDVTLSSKIRGWSDGDAGDRRCVCVGGRVGRGKHAEGNHVNVVETECRRRTLIMLAIPLPKRLWLLGPNLQQHGLAFMKRGRAFTEICECGIFACQEVDENAELLRIAFR